MKKIILASASPRRRELLTKAGVEFEIRSVPVDESVREGTSPVQAAKAVAEKKALAASNGSEDEIIVGADTLVAADGKILGKPKDAEDAKKTLAFLSGKEHEVVTGVCIARGKEKIVFAATSRVKFRELTAGEIEAYVSTGEPMDKAGSYGIQGLGRALVERIDGDFFNVVGLPLDETLEAIRRAGGEKQISRQKNKKIFKNA